MDLPNMYKLGLEVHIPLLDCHHEIASFACVFLSVYGLFAVSVYVFLVLPFLLVYLNKI